MIICSLTTLKGRDCFAYKTINSLINQTIKPDLIILYYQGEESEIDQKISDINCDYFSIRYLSSKYKSYSKFYYALKDYPNDIIILCDDDIVYNIDYIKNLYEFHLKHNDIIICNAYHEIICNNNSYIHNGCTKSNYIISNSIKPLSGWGTLIPSNYYNIDDIKLIDDFVINVPTDDESWIFYINKLKQKNVCCIGKYKKYIDICIERKIFDNRLVLKNTVPVLSKYGKYIYNILNN